jgi:hypothetical protein
LGQIVKGNILLRKYSGYQEQYHCLRNLVIHEIGHVLCLRDIDRNIGHNGSTIMEYSYSSDQLTTFGEKDIRNLNYLYRGYYGS